MANQQGMQPPYIGSKISLISKLDIRYEGTLYTVDPVESTIALAKVHSYGTEGRRTPVFVPPRDEVYDFIIFKASDIKDLIVCEQPKATSPESAAANGLPYDPAIVSISKNPPPEPKLPPRLNMVKGTPVGMGSGRGGILPEKLGIRPSFEQLLGPMRFNYRFPHFQPTPPMLHTRVKRASGSNAVEELKIFDKDYDFEKANEQFREKIIEDLKDDKVEQPKEAKSAIELVASTEEQQEKEADENETAIVLTDEQQRAQQDYYDKKSSFFDNISCDTLEKESGKNVRPDWKRERRTNQETFGSAAVRSLFIQQRGARGGGFIGDRQQMPPAFFNYRYQNYQQPSHNRNYMHRQQQQLAGHRNY